MEGEMPLQPMRDCYRSQSSPCGYGALLSWLGVDNEQTVLV
jgi:hypothetical protein